MVYAPSPWSVMAHSARRVAKGSNLLDALNDAGLNVPYSCRAGSCHACLVRCLQGEPQVARPQALDADLLLNSVQRCSKRKRPAGFSESTFQQGIATSHTATDIEEDRPPLRVSSSMLSASGQC